MDLIENTKDNLSARLKALNAMFSFYHQFNIREDLNKGSFADKIEHWRWDHEEGTCFYDKRDGFRVVVDHYGIKLCFAVQAVNHVWFIWDGVVEGGTSTEC